MKAKYIIPIVALLAIGSAAFAVDVDGTIAPEEYAFEASYDRGNFRLLWKISGDTLFMAIDSSASGLVSVGFEPTRVMANSDMIFGMIPAEGPAQAVDAWSTGMFGPHPPDTNQGGKDSLLSFAGKRSGGRVVFEFSRLLDTGDKFDKVVPKTGEFKIIWAYGPNLSFTAKHSKAGSATILMDGRK